MKKNNAPPRALLFSQRNIFEPLVYRSSIYEFEDIIGQIDSVEMLAPKPKPWFKLCRDNSMRICKYAHIMTNPGLPAIKLEKNYDLFFAICQNPADLLNLNTIKRIGDYCKTSVCWLDEIWVNQIPMFHGFLKILSKFDYVILNCKQSLNAIEKIIEKKCFYVPLGVDAMLFCPFPDNTPRCIDILSIGRRSLKTHQSILKLAKTKGLFYYYDTINSLSAINIEQHRLMLSNLAKRSKYFVVYPGKIDITHERGTQEEIGSRYFEALASGALMIGDTPKNDVFQKEFPFPNVVIDMPYGFENVEDLFSDLEKAEYQHDILRMHYIVQALLNHDWVYRWEKVLEIAGISVMPGLIERKNQLQMIAQHLQAQIS